MAETTTHAEAHDELKYQLRIQMPDAFAHSARSGTVVAELQPLWDVLEKHDAQLVCQFDAFAGFCERLERSGEIENAMYKWTKATIDDPDKKAKYVKIFTIYVAGEEVYDAAAADSLERDMQQFVGGTVIETMSRYDTNPANNPQPPEKYRS